MAVNPSTFRTNATNAALGPKITPSSSPYHRNMGTKTQSRMMRQDIELSLRRVIGTTTSSASGFDSLASARTFAYTAGSAVILASLDEDLHVTQRFFRARPTATPVNSTAYSIHSSTPGSIPHDSRNRTATSLKDSGIGHSPMGSPFGELGDTPSSKTWTARERIKAATCVSLSQDGKFLAVGETGYNPRVLIFSTAQDALPDIPLTVLSEHTYGIRCVAFSPDSRYLASLGNMNDGFLYIWSINSKTGSARLHLSNKCTSYVRHLAWVGTSLVTVGTRHVKVWKPYAQEEPIPQSPLKLRSAIDATSQNSQNNLGPRALPGRNSLLGPMAEATFTCVTRISDDKSLICSEKGDICLLDDSEGMQRLVKVGSVPSNICSSALDTKGARVYIGQRNGKIRTFDLSVLLTPKTPPPSPTSQAVSPSLSHEAQQISIVAIASLDSVLITLDSSHSIKLLNRETIDNAVVPTEASDELLAHRNAVLGVQLLYEPNNFDASFFTWSANGSVLFWNLDGKCKSTIDIELEQLYPSDDHMPNELKVVRASQEANFFVSGDKYGVVGVIDGTTRERIFDIKAHAAEVTDIVICEDSKFTIFASCGRDRMIQIFKRIGRKWQLLQTLDEHIGAISGLVFTNKGEKLLSCSSDRTIVIREIISRAENDDIVLAYLPIRTLTLKATPLSMTLLSDDDRTLVVSTVDRHIQKFDITSGRNIHTFRASDSESNDAVVMDALVATKSIAEIDDPRILIGISSADKSVRLYEHCSGELLSRESGHTEGITDVALLETSNGDLEEGRKRTLISTGSDGTIMIWELSPKSQHIQENSAPTLLCGETFPTKETAAAKTPLRRVLSKSDLAEFHRPSDSEGLSQASTPTACRSPQRTIRKKTSKYSLAQSPKCSVPPTPTVPSKYNASTSSQGESTNRRVSRRERSQSPPSPRPNQHLPRPRRSSLDARSRTKSSGNPSEFGGPNLSTEQVCRTLRAFRRKLMTSSETLRADNVRELERELGATLKALGEKAVRSKAASESMITDLLGQYSERLVEMIDEKLSLRGATRAETDSPVSLIEENQKSLCIDTVGEG
ncbi:MAG: hypothetical protein M1827_005014 [Pycnora praestabilis]|nr:MAG: hypothetical protein M1827_005014 [Pycnora praestabilis]